jgi:hypothetical protein
MSKIDQKNSVDQEIDLSMISNKIGKLLENLNTSIFRGIQFFIKNKIILGILLLLGFGLGIYLDDTNKTYDNQIVVQPNFGSTDYLYSKIDLLQSKIREKDTAFLASIGIKEPSKLSKIEIEPIVDVYKFVNDNEKNFELLKLMSEDNDLKKIIEEKATSKNYKQHLISFTTKRATSNSKTIIPLINFLNNSEFYKKIQKEEVNNVQTKIKANDIIISQIDGFLNGFTNSDTNLKSEKLVYYNENSPLNDIIKTKDKLISEQGFLRITLVGFDTIIKETSSTLNKENKETVNGKQKFILPIVLIFLFIFIRMFIRFYKNQASKNKE